MVIVVTALAFVQTAGIFCGGSKIAKPQAAGTRVEDPDNLNVNKRAPDTRFHPSKLPIPTLSPPVSSSRKRSLLSQPTCSSPEDPMQYPTRHRWYSLGTARLGRSCARIGHVHPRWRHHVPPWPLKGARRGAAPETPLPPSVTACKDGDKLVLAVHAFPEASNPLPSSSSCADSKGQVLSEHSNQVLEGGNRFVMAQPKVANNQVTVVAEWLEPAPRHRWHP